MATAPPLTPRLVPVGSYANTPPAHKRGPIPEILKALRQDCVDRVREALDANPDAIWCPPLDYSVDPPLCVAVELGCKPEVIKLLLDRGADVSAENAQGQTPLSLLKENSHDMSQDVQHFQANAITLKMTMPPTYSWNALGDQVSVVKCKGEKARHAGHFVAASKGCRAAWRTRDDDYCFAAMPPQSVRKFDLTKPALREKLHGCEGENVDEAGHLESPATLFCAAWGAQDDYFGFAEMPLRFPTVPDLSDPDLHEKLDGVLLGTLNL